MTFEILFVLLALLGMATWASNGMQKSMQALTIY